MEFCAQGTGILVTTLKQNHISEANGKPSDRPPGKELQPQYYALPHRKPNLWHLAEFFCHNQFQSHRSRISQDEDP